MRVPQHLEQAIAQGDLATLEADWLSTLEKSPQDLSYFAAVSRALLDRGEKTMARTLLELIDDELAQKELYEERLELIRAVGKDYLKPGSIFDTVLESVHGLYRDRPQELEAALEAVGLDKGRDETTKLWDRVERLKNLLAFQVDTLVAMKDRGVGRVVEVNLALQSLKIDFESHKGLAVGLRAASKVLDILDADHILRRKVEGLDELQDLSPGELLGVALRSYDQALTATELRGILAGVVPDAKWNRWWSTARKHPQVVTIGKGRQSYRWAESREDAADEFWSAFDKAGVREKLEALRRASNQSETLRTRMAAELARLGSELQEENPALAFEIWHVLDRAGAPPSSFTPEAIIQATGKMDSFLKTLSSRALREQAYESIQRTRNDASEILSRAFTTETEPLALDRLAAIFRDDPALDLDRCLDQIVGRPRRSAAAFVWLAERAGNDEGLRARFGGRLLRLALHAFGDPIFAPFKARLEQASESGKSLPRLLAELPATEAKDVEAALKGATGLPDYLKGPLLNALYLKFPELEQEQEEQPLYATTESLESKRRELKTLLEEEIPANRRAIEEARALGDLRENFEYKSARQRHEYLAARAASLNHELSRVKLLESPPPHSNEVRIGTRVHLSSSQGERSIEILGPWESDPEAGVLSYESDVAKNLLGKKVGDQLAIGSEDFEITAIEASTRL